MKDNKKKKPKLILSGFQLALQGFSLPVKDLQGVCKSNWLDSAAVGISFNGLTVSVALNVS